MSSLSLFIFIVIEILNLLRLKAVKLFIVVSVPFVDLLKMIVVPMLRDTKDGDGSNFSKWFYRYVM